MKILVTGGAGFIGSNFIRHILAKYKDYKIINLDKLTYAGNLDNLKDIENNPNYKFVEGDICDKEIVEKVVKDCDVIVHFAAETHVDRSIGDPDAFIMTDIIGTHALLEAAKKFNIKKMIICRKMHFTVKSFRPKIISIRFFSDHSYFILKNINTFIFF